MRLEIDKKKCIKCFGCVSVCPNQALESTDDGPKWNKDKCTGCGACVNFCPVKALKLVNE